MDKKYVMFVDERGFVSKDVNDNFTMIGVIFEQDYCIDIRRKLNEYKEEIFSNTSFNIHLDDVILKEKVYKNIDKNIINKFINGLPSLFKNLKFTIISSTIKQDTHKVNDPYSAVTKKLLKKFYSFLIRKNGESGGIILEARRENISYVMQQNFFNIYHERNTNLSFAGNISDKINTFIVSEKNNKAYGLGIELLNILNSIFYRVSNGYREIDKNLISYIEYGNKNKIFNAIKYKIYSDVNIGISSEQLQKSNYNNMVTFDKELRILRDELKLKEIRINEKEKEINELTNEIKLLNKQLEEVLFVKRSDKMISKIISDIDVKVNGFNKIINIAKS
jgi:hypothetical protein